MIEKDSRFQNVVVGGRLAWGKTSDLVQSKLPIVASGPWTFYQKTFTAAELPPFFVTTFNMDIDTSNSKNGDRLAIFFKMPINHNWLRVRIQFPITKAYITMCSPNVINDYLMINYDPVVGINQRCRLSMVYSEGRFINTSDTNN